MSALPIQKRKFDAFLSHAHVDKEVTDKIQSWLTDIAGVAVWYDATHLQPSASIATSLSQAIAECRGMIIAVSKASLQSGWVKEEYSAAIGQRTSVRDYRIIPLRLDESPVPDFLQTTKWVDLNNGNISVRAANELLASLYGEELSIEPRKARDVYISRTWRDSEALPADRVCAILSNRGLRLIGDAKDQAGFEDGTRVKSIIHSCGGLVAVLPDRGNGSTSKYILDEIAFGLAAGLPCLVVAPSSVHLSPDIESIAVRVEDDEAGQIDSLTRKLTPGVDRIDEEWRRPPQPQYAVLATSFGAQHAERNRVLQQVIERVTAIPCVLGDDIREGQIQSVITNSIRNSFLFIADVSEENVNTCIEAGIAMGAGRRMHLVARGPRRRPPFMFRDQQVWHYDDDVELIGRIHRIAYPYRRRVLKVESHW